MRDLSPTLLANPTASPSVIPLAWIDRLFQRMHALYGKHWADLWADVPLADVKDAWRTAIGPASGEAIKAALTHCERNCRFPPTAPEFARLCADFRPPATTFVALPHQRDRTPVDLAVQAEVELYLAKGRTRRPRDWARKILAEAEAGKYKLPIGLYNAKVALGIIKE